MKIVSFLGLGNYQETTYILNSRQCKTPFCQEALVDFYTLRAYLKT
ncbi:hypothetical protein K9N68_13165 [Kovacikia minuta CCNUW1]|nr:TM1812 family CRISPR-associated protein [Kovacikia minuta]UBF28706.1 hypothetical protein K9N68_13165 [Kovacikia minuta CCNUW1]